MRGASCPRRRPELRNWLDLGLGLGGRRGDRIEPGGGSGLRHRPAERAWHAGRPGRRHCGDRPVFEVGWRIDVRRKLLDDPTDLAVLVDDGLAVAATAEMAVELGPLGRGQVAAYEVEGLGVGGLDVPLRKHRRHLAGWRSSARKVSAALAIRDLTVPIGMSRRSAISEWVKPSRTRRITSA